MKKTFVTLFALACLALSSAAAFAAVPTVIPYQGRLTDAAGNPVNGAQNLRFRIFTVITGGTLAYEEIQNGVTVTNGLFNVSIGSVTALPPALFTGGDLFLEIQAGAETMTPRQRFGSVPYAFRAGLSPGAASASADISAILPATQNSVTLNTTMPGPGLAIVSGMLYCQFNHTNGTTDQVSIGVNNVSATMPPFPNVTRSLHGAEQPNGSPQATLFVQRVIPVPAAGPMTFFLVTQRNGGVVFGWGANLVVHYVPDAIGTVGREGDTVPEFRPSGVASTQGLVAPVAGQ